ncbi:acetyl-CoA carboxylase biotin carboxyl carrier protein [Aeromicrobium wangtongii]|uniref:Biotin carboxyl carrier protein of acetyl-CoA carboxylase n=1 Tax=Aeromicrobium wangtongii TaxID=2969247 RepID=A0ABY5MDF4_9ACTN|nr:biotin/lipoyl-containing protein [Aeromicrobium wangtongii]MCD9197687.1 biotin/lipoyl-binding protein [Aeromicrobium wangtongii]UUP15171.1 biotin/lipoyl-binding protein [Aeromicrobium wangtongii]
MTDIRPDDVAVLSRLMDEHGWTSLRVSIGTTTVVLGEAPAPETAAPPSPARASSSAVRQDTAGAAQDGAGSDPARPHEASTSAGVTVTAPNLGTFYRAPAPGEASYVELGQRVEAEDEVCLIEVMKLYTPVRAGAAGVVVEVLVEDGALVEYGQPLVVIDPDG